jgi:hypothetical protein
MVERGQDNRETGRKGYDPRRQGRFLPEGKTKKGTSVAPVLIFRKKEMSHTTLE